MSSSTEIARFTGTRHADLSARLRAAIEAGRFAPGSLLPTEYELAHIHGVSRQTVRTALQTLEDFGYISRKKGVGTRVEAAQPSTSFVHTIESLDDLVHVASVEIRQIDGVESIVLDRTLARSLEAPLGSRWICFSGLRLDARKPQRPISQFRIFIDERFSSVVDPVRNQPSVLVAALLERECSQTIEEVHQKVSAILLDKTLARPLNVNASSAGLRILRHYKGHRREILEITETIYFAEHVTVSSLLRRRKSNRSKL